ncbi:RluA family pseudouridine synthase [Cochleicola gelatinilyticus]|uniref:RluA family pseudouridine synthase n=1 Tax=Cochleicola gelatinilyticus TaxID=1763537 RepID=UPI001F527847|nr:RluA family pseudouridine synthase [Cochleicola gelatinilyticus]
MIFLNDSVAHGSNYINGGEIITLYRDEELFLKKQIELSLSVCYEDDHLAIIHKPAGILVSGNKAKTIVNALSFNLKKSQQPDALLQPQPAHRLDFATNGLLVIGKSKSALQALNLLFKKKQIVKTYHAVTQGAMIKTQHLDIAVDGKKSATNYKVLKTVASSKYVYLNLVQLQPLTGRRHQLRKHMAEIGSPILGDALYGIEGAILKGKGLFLQASSLSFRHPFTSEEISIMLPLPKKFQKLFPV